MKMFTITLEQQWQCTYSGLSSLLENADLDQEQPIRVLTKWTYDPMRIEPFGKAWLKRTFALTPQEECMRYALLIDSAPQGSKVYVNDKEVARYAIGDDDAPFDLDVTEQVMLGINWIAFQVDCEAVGGFEGVRLLATECE